jgi:hypothetical protein
VADDVRRNVTFKDCEVVYRRDRAQRDRGIARQGNGAGGNLGTLTSLSG